MKILMKNILQLLNLARYIYFYFFKIELGKNLWLVSKLPVFHCEKSQKHRIYNSSLTAITVEGMSSTIETLWHSFT